MDESLQNETERADADVANALREQRDRAQEFLSKWHRSVSDLERQLTEQLESALREIAAQIDVGGEEDLQQRHEELSGWEHRLKEQQSELSAREARIEEQALAAQEVQSRLNDRLDELQTLLGELEQRRDSAHEAESQLSSVRSEQQAASESLDRQRMELEDQQQSLEEQAAQIASAQEKVAERERCVADSRQQLARELKLRRKEQFAEVELKRKELEQIVAREDSELESRIGQFQDELSRLQRQTDERKQQAEELRGQLEAAHAQTAKREAENRELLNRLEQIASSDNRQTAEAAELTAELAEARERAESQYAASEAALKQARNEQQQLHSDLQTANEDLQKANERIESLESRAEALGAQVEAAGNESSQQRIRELEDERNALLERLAESEELADKSTTSISEEFEQLQRRYETALNEIHELKVSNAKLEERQSAPGGVASGAAMDWEAQKQRMLAQLEADIDEDDPDQAKDRLTVEGAIQMTDLAVAEKDKEIDELRRLLSDQSQNLGGVAVGAAAIADMLDTDDLVKQEREKLEHLQQEWREKLRKAEIDISVERAKIARERAQVEEKLQALEQRTISDDQDNSAETEAPKRGKWLARLGLGDSD